MARPFAEQVLLAHLKQLERHTKSRGIKGLEKLYKQALGDLQTRLRSVRRTGSEPPTALELQALIDQADQALVRLAGDVEKHLQDVSATAKELGARQGIDEYTKLAKHYTGTTPVLELDAAAVLGGLQDVDASLLRRYRLQSRRWSLQAVEAMERALSVGTMAKKPLDSLISDVLGAEGFEGEQWKAEQIVRTETAYAHAAAKQRAMEKTAEESDTPLFKRLIETFDNRTGDDSFVLHGQTVPIDKPFEWKHKKGGSWVVTKYMHPPNRPNDRAVVIPWDPEWEETAEERPLTKPELAGAPPTRWRKRAGVEIPPGHRPGLPYSGR